MRFNPFLFTWTTLRGHSMYARLIGQSYCGHFSDNLKIIATDGFTLRNVSLVSQDIYPDIEMGNIYFLGTKKGVVFRMFWCHFTFTANQLVVIEDTIMVTKSTFCLFIVITPCQIHLSYINKKKEEKCFKF